MIFPNATFKLEDPLLSTKYILYILQYNFYYLNFKYSENLRKTVLFCQYFSISSRDLKKNSNTKQCNVVNSILN